ncbi:ABC transporter substrate-binding protein [Luteimicrobium subarcticum]|uniref:Peptide/nickel transport system substrate-binding protein n=1 Tax=Luteimicrobium subarcticum TaxID=620910 RepID=A0A2M8WSA2_9MICO|nr:ABC transporter substrate-binding protein [Luteimicrobium subarcticum]PJI93832.1 peptide/nickel transport system substrate-binding protein [Luteimicrobium subarcticum]
MIRSTRRKSVVGAVALASGLSLLLAGCGGGSKGSENTPASAGKATGVANSTRVLNVWAGEYTPMVDNFNPYSPTVLHAAMGPIYETLFYFNKAGSGAPKPLLGDSYEFNADGTQLTIKVKSGVKWSDGTPFTAKDVAYTYNFSLSKPAYLKSAEATDDTTVVLSFDGPQFTNEFSLLGATVIIPEHIWKDVKDPAKFTNDDPVGTGPYVVKKDSFSSQAYTVVANPNYRDAGTPKIKEVRYVAVDGDPQAENLLKQGKIDWTGMFIPDVDAVTATGAGYINTPQDPTTIYTCSSEAEGCKGAQTDVAVRQALNLAIDRKQINDKAFKGLGGTISPTFAQIGRDDQWITNPDWKESPQSADAAAASKILEEAGYTKDADGFYAKDGKEIDLTLKSPTDWTDYNQAAELVASQAKAAGIKITASTISQQEWSDARTSGNFELLVGGVVGTSVADPFQIYKDWFSGESTTKVGTALKPGTWNFTRYSNPEVDAAVKAAASTQDEAKKKEAYATIQKNIVNDVPYIPVIINATQTFYNTKDVSGWPTQDDLYAFPPSWGSGSAGVILANLVPLS